MEPINELATALAKAQSKMEGAAKDTSNPFFKSKYADLASVTGAVRSGLDGTGLSYVQLVHDKPDCAAIETLILHSSGQSLSTGIVCVPVAKHDAQGYGSAITYARRYGLAMAFGVAPEDDDGNAATKAKPTPQPKPTAPDAEDIALAKEYAEAVVTAFSIENDDGMFVEDASARARGNEFYLLYWNELKPHSAVRSKLKKHFEESLKKAA